MASSGTLQTLLCLTIISSYCVNGQGEYQMEDIMEKMSALGSNSVPFNLDRLIGNNRLRDRFLGGGGVGRSRKKCIRMWSGRGFRDTWFDICSSNERLSYCNAGSVRSACASKRQDWILFEQSGFTGQIFFIPFGQCRSGIPLRQVGSMLKCRRRGNRLKCRFPQLPWRRGVFGRRNNVLGGNPQQRFESISLAELERDSLNYNGFA